MVRGLARFGGASPARWLLFLLALAAPAFAQDLGVAEKLAGGTVEYVLAVAVVVMAAVVFYLFRAWREEVAGRREDAKEHQQQTISMLTSVVTLNAKMNEAIDVLEKAVEQLLQERRS